MAELNCTCDRFCSKNEDDGYYTTTVSLACQIAAISFLIITCILGNLLLCYAVYRTSSKLTASSVFILNLAVIDILVGTLILPFWILSTATLSWPLPHAVCEFTAFMTVTLMQCSIFSLSGIAVDRYFNISHPLRYPIEATLTRMGFVVMSIWAFCLCIASFPIYGWGDYRFQPQTVPICNPEYISQVTYSIVLIVFGMTLPFVIMLFSYVKILQITRDHIQQIDALQNSFVKTPSAQICTRTPGSLSGTNAWGPRTSHHTKPSLRTKFSKNVKAVRKVFIAVGVFFFCWGPYVILNFWSVNNEHVPVPYIADLLTTLLAFANSSINPIIFILLNKDLRRAVKQLGRRVCAGATQTQSGQDSPVTFVADRSENRVRRTSHPSKLGSDLHVEDMERVDVNVVNGVNVI